ncbi:MAG: cytochrome b/b6 domain-containing protein [Holophaga sp.]|nr:cytochrome b/b6 domain-containing protein [Holophaga sp.]
MIFARMPLRVRMGEIERLSGNWLILALLFSSLPVIADTQGKQPSPRLAHPSIFLKDEDGTYLSLLNILLPYQILTGLLMWGVTRWPSTFQKVGGLTVLGPAHTLGSYLFLAFLIGHIYLATTGKTPFSLLRAMITGFEEPGPRKE